MHHKSKQSASPPSSTMNRTACAVKLAKSKGTVVVAKPVKPTTSSRVPPMVKPVKPAKSGAATRTAVEYDQPAAADPADAEPIDAVAIDSVTATEVMLKPVAVGMMAAMPPTPPGLAAPNLDSTRSGGVQ